MDSGIHLAQCRNLYFPTTVPTMPPLLVHASHKNSFSFAASPQIENAAADEQRNFRYFPFRELLLIKAGAIWSESQSRFRARRLLSSRNRLAQRAEGHAASGRHRQGIEDRSGR